MPSFDHGQGDTPSTPGTKAGTPGDVIGKITVGYQGWFTAAGDGGPLNGWWHYGQDWTRTPPAPSRPGRARTASS